MIWGILCYKGTDTMESERMAEAEHESGSHSLRAFTLCPLECCMWVLTQ